MVGNVARLVRGYDGIAGDGASVTTVVQLC